MARPFALAIVAILLAGCAGTPEGDLLPLSSTTRCPAELQSVGVNDCDHVQAQAQLEPAPPAGWACVPASSHDEGAGKRFSLWTDGEGHFGLWVDWSRFPEPVKVQTRVAFESGGKEERANFPGATGFLRMTGTFGDTGTISAWSWGMAANGTRPHLSTEKLSIVQMEHPTGAVFVWDFHADDGAVHRFAPFIVVKGPEPPRPDVVPVDWNVVGSDFSVSGRAYSGLGFGGTYDAGGLPVLPLLAETCPT